MNNWCAWEITTNKRTIQRCRTFEQNLHPPRIKVTNWDQVYIKKHWNYGTSQDHAELDFASHKTKSHTHFIKHLSSINVSTALNQNVNEAPRTLKKPSITLSLQFDDEGRKTKINGRLWLEASIQKFHMMLRQRKNGRKNESDIKKERGAV